MRLLKRYLIRVVKKRLIEFILMFSVISIVLFGVFMAEARSGTGILYHSGDNWFIGLNYRINNNNFYTYLGIRNPDSFPHVLIPENNGTEVLYLLLEPYSFFPITPPFIYSFFHISPPFVYVFALDLVPVFIIKQSILYVCIVIFSITVFPCLYLNRKKLPITNKLLG